MSNTYENPEARWREIARQMRGEATWEQGVNGLALTLHSAAERLTTAELLTFSGDLSAKFATRLIGDPSLEGMGVTEELIDDIISALMTAALDITDSFAHTGGGNA